MPTFLRFASLLFFASISKKGKRSMEHDKPTNKHMQAEKAKDITRFAAYCIAFSLLSFRLACVCWLAYRVSMLRFPLLPLGTKNLKEAKQTNLGTIPPQCLEQFAIVAPRSSMT